MKGKTQEICWNLLHYHFKRKILYSFHSDFRSPRRKAVYMILSFTSYSKWFYYTFTLHNTVSHSRSDQSGYSFSNGNTNTANRNYNMLVSEETGKRNKVIVEMIPLIPRHTHTHRQFVQPNQTLRGGFGVASSEQGKVLKLLGLSDILFTNCFNCILMYSRTPCTTANKQTDEGKRKGTLMLWKKIFTNFSSNWFLRLWKFYSFSTHWIEFM